MGPAGSPDPLGLSSGEKRKASGLGVLAGVIERMLTVEVPEGKALGLGIPLGGVTHTHRGCQSRLSWAELPGSVQARSRPFPRFCYLMVIKEWRETPQSWQFN